MTRLTIVILTASLVSPSAALAWGKSMYYSYDEDRSATYTSRSNDKPADASTKAPEAPTEVQTTSN